jgi:plastocyanin
MRTIVEARFHRNNPTPAILLVCCALLFPSGSAAQSLLERTPNINGGWTGAPGVVHFNFLHRFTRSPAPARQVTNTPTFLLAYSPVQRALVGVNYVTRSDLVAAFPNEWEFFARYAPFEFASLQVGYNNAAESVDAEIGAHYDIGRLRLLGAGRVLSNAFADDSLRFVVAAGGALRLNRWIALAGDVARPVTVTDNEDLAWSAALQLAIPYTPHTFSLQAANTNSATLQGSSRGSGSVRYGFEFTIPVTLARWFGGATTSAGGGASATGTRVAMKNMQFTPRSISVPVGGTVVWKNDDQLAHTVTAADGSWTSPLLEPGGTYEHKFESAGRFEITCSPHPFMKSVVEVVP